MKILHIANLFKIIQNCVSISICGCLLLSNSNASNTQSNTLGIDYADSEIKKNNKKIG